jgi:hypothetical protein
MKANVRRAAIATLVIVAFGSCSAWFVNKYFGIEEHALLIRLWPPPTASQVARIQLQKLAGWYSLDCGHVRHRQNADSVIDCAQNALKTGRRFYVAFDWVGLDSHGTTGLAANSKGLYEVDTDEVRWGGLIASTLHVAMTITPCEIAPTETILYPANRVLTCLPEPSDEQTGQRQIY